jgi:hypothetical protein
MFPASYQIEKFLWPTALDRGKDLGRGAAAAAVWLHRQPDATLRGVGGRLAHHFVVMVILLGLVDTKREDILERQFVRGVDLLSHLLDRLLERDVVARAQRSHVGLQAAGRAAASSGSAR